MILSPKLMDKQITPFIIKKSKRIYTLKLKIRGKGSIKFNLKKIITDDGNQYKLIQANIFGIFTGGKNRIKKVIRNLNEYESKSSVPNLKYFDSKTVVVEWIEGESITGNKKDEMTYQQLAKFNAENFINIKKIPLIKLINELTDKINLLLNLGSISQQTGTDLIALCKNTNFIGTDSFCDSLCFADTATKNYIKTLEKNPRLVYIDIFGIDRRLVSRVFAKQLIQTPIEFRKKYADIFLSTIPLQIESNLPLSYLDYLITRIYSGVVKRNILNRKKRKEKTEHAIYDLHSFIDATKNDLPLVDWIINNP